MCAFSYVYFSTEILDVIERFLALYFSPIDGKQPTYVSKSRNDMLFRKGLISVLLLYRVGQSGQSEYMAYIFT